MNGPQQQPPPPPPTKVNMNKKATTTTTTINGSSQPQPTPITTLYHPSIFRYTCTGKLNLDSKYGSKSPHSAGICRGIQSKLQHIEHWQLTTKDDAIQTFQQRMMMLDNNDDNMTTTQQQQQKKKSKDHPLPPSTITPSSPVNGDPSSSGTAHAMQAVYLSNVLVYPPEQPPPSTDDDERKNSKNNNNHNKNNRSRDNGVHNTNNNNLPSTVSVVPPQNESWRCYGSTEIDLLVLRPHNTKEECIAAVSPYCTPGSTIRELSTPTLGKERTTTIRLGIVEIIYQSLMDNDYYNNNEDNIDGKQAKGTTTTHPVTANKNNDSTNKTKDGSTKNESRETNNKNNSKNGNDADTNNNNNNNNTTFPGKVYQSSLNIARHMKQNGQILWDSVQDDYPHRTYEAGRRIVGEFEKTADRTVGLMKKVFHYAIKGDWDDGDDTNNDGGNGKPPKR